MSKFNSTKTDPKPDTVTHEGAVAHAQSDERALAAYATTSFVEDTFYESADAGLDRVRKLIASVDPEFAAKAALYARNVANLRSVSHVIAGEVAASVKGETWTKTFFDKVVVRPDDMTEIVSYYLANHGKSIPNSLKKGFSRAFGKFDEYSLGKYRGEGKEVSLVDVANLVHPRPTNKNASALKKLVGGTLRNHGTWNAKLSAVGPDEGAKAQVWEEFLANPRVEYFALVRNLRNIADQAPHLIPKAAELVKDRDRVLRSKLLPFRFVTALKEVPGVAAYQKALSDALDISVENFPEFENALVIIDTSGSMSSPVAGSDKITCVELGAVFGSALAIKSGADVMAFGDSTEFINIRPQDSVNTNAERVLRANVGHGTRFDLALTAPTKKYDNIIIFSDMQAFGGGGSFGGWGGYYGNIKSSTEALSEYRKKTGANPNVFAFDLRGYGTSQFPEKKVFQISGYSDKILGVMNKLAQDRDALVNEIKAIEL